MGKTFKDSNYTMKYGNTKKQDRVELNYSLMIANLEIMKLISNQKLKATVNNLLKNDCPLQCNKNIVMYVNSEMTNLNRFQQ